MASDEVGEAQTVRSATHGAIALLGATVADKERGTNQLGQWTAVYGRNHLDIDAPALFQRIFSDGPPRTQDGRIVSAEVQEMLMDKVATAIQETTSTVSAAATELHTTWTTAQRAVSYRLLELLAEATGTSKRELVAELEVWASEQEE